MTLFVIIRNTTNDITVKHKCYYGMLQKPSHLLAQVIFKKRKQQLHTVTGYILVHRSWEQTSVRMAT